MHSIRRELLIALLAAVLVAGCIAALIVYHRVRQQTGELLDYHLRQMALAVRDETIQGTGRFEPPPYGLDYAIQISSGDGLELYYSRLLHQGLGDEAVAAKPVGVAIQFRRIRADEPLEHGFFRSNMCWLAPRRRDGQLLCRVRFVVSQAVDRIEKETHRVQRFRVAVIATSVSRCRIV